jgi:hypothetical protein
MITLAPAIRNSRLTIIAQALDSAATPGKIRLYEGDRPDAETLGTQTLLAELRLPKPLTWRVNSGRLVMDARGETLCRRSGIARWARLLDGDNGWVMDIDVGVTGSGAALELNRIELFAGGSLQLTMNEIREA